MWNLNVLGETKYVANMQMHTARHMEHMLRELENKVFLCSGKGAGDAKFTVSAVEAAEHSVAFSS